jgi:phytoene dehydrogenase-like protein
VADERDCDVVIVGAGHNGLTCAGYLAQGGLSVKLVERRDVVGGAAVSEEFHPGFRNSVASYVVSLLDPQVIADLELGRHGLEILPRPGGSFHALPGGEHLHLSGDPAEKKREVAKFSRADAEALDAFDAELEGLVGLLRALAREAPANLGGGWADAWTALKLGRRLYGLGPDKQQALAELMTMSVGDYLDRWFESDPIKGALGYEGIIGNFVGPYHQGSAYVLLHHAFGQTNGRTAAWGYPRGGMGAITQAMAASARERGVAIETGAPVREVIAEGGRATGVVLEDGRAVRARAVAGNVNPKLLYGRMLDPALLPEDFRRRIAGWRCRSGTFRMNVALAELPRFESLNGHPEPEQVLNGSVDIGPSLGYLDAAYMDAKRAGWSREPVVSMCIPSILDETLAPAGRHVASLFCQHFNPELPDGSSWDDHRESVADLILDTVDRYAPNFKASVLGRQILSPLDLERDFGLVGGDIFHGALHLDQLYSLRPAAGYADYRSPVQGLYLCGSGAHPGGGVSGLPGWNAARAILKDAKKGRLAA